MIKNFNDFFKENKQKVNESAEAVSNEMFDDSVVLDSNDLETAKDFVAPDLVSDDRFLSKIAVIIVRRLNKNTSIKFTIHPFIVETNGEKCALITSESICIAAFRKGITKTVVVYNGNPLDGVDEHEFVLTTNKLGFKDLVNTLILFIDNNGGINEAKTYAKLTEIAPPSEEIATPYPKLCKDIEKIPEDAMHEFLKLYEEMDDMAIVHYLEDNVGSYPDGIDACMDVFKCTNISAYKRTVKGIHCILCAMPGIGGKPEVQKAIREVWFYGAGTSGHLAIEITKSGKYIVKESSAVLDQGVDELDRKMKEVKKIADAICRYVKSDGRDIAGIKGTISDHRGLIITGKGGIGKTYSFKKSLKENGMREGIDYLRFSGSSMGAGKVYKDLYDGNNMLLIYDDNPGMFSGDLKIGLWKVAMDPDDGNRLVEKPTEAGENSTIFYDSDDPDMTRQQRYFAEVGKLSPYDKEKWIKSKIKQLKTSTKGTGISKKGAEEMSYDSLKKWALSMYKDYEDNELTPLIPTKFHFDGIVVYVCNDTLSEFRAQIKSSWDAIQSRFYIVDISPTNKVIWAWLKKMIIRDAEDSTKPDEIKVLPTKSDCDGYSIENFINLVDDIISGKYNDGVKTYGAMNFRVLSLLRTFIAYGTDDWKNKVLDEMLIDTERE